MADSNDSSKAEKALNSLGLKEYTEKIKEALETWMDITVQIEEIDKESYKVVKAFGGGAENVRAIKSNLVDSRDELIKLGMTQSDITDLIIESGTELGRNTILTKDTLVSLGESTKATGLSARDLTAGFKDTGYSLAKVGDEMTKVMNTALGLGVNAKAVSSEVVRNMDKMNLFTFQGGVEGMARMASQASMLRIDMGKTLTLAENLFSPEKAIDLAASLQRLGATQSSLLDPLKLMDLAQNDPTELQNQIVEMTKSFSQFNETTGKFEIAPGGRRQLKEISEALGMSYQDLSKMALGSAELDDKLSKMHIPDKFANDDQRKMIANLAEMNKQGQYEIKFFDERLNKTVTKLVDDLGEGDAEMIEKMGDPKDMSTLAKNQLSVSESMDASLKVIAGRPGYAAAESQVGEDFLKMAKQTTESISKISTSIVDYKKTAEFGDEAFADLYKASKDVVNIMTGKGNLIDALDDLSKAGEKTVKFFDETFKSTITTTVEELGKFKDTLKKFDDKYGGKNSKEAKDVEISANGQNIKLLPEDTLYAGTSPQSLAYRMAEMAGKNNVKQTSQGSNSTLDITHRIAFDNLPPHINEGNLVHHMEKIMNNITFQQGLSKTIEEINRNYNLTA